MEEWELQDTPWHHATSAQQEKVLFSLSLFWHEYQDVSFTFLLSREES